MLFEIFNEDWAQKFGTLEDIMRFLLLYVIFLIVMAIFLKIALSFFSGARNREFGSVFLSSFLITVIYALTFLFLGTWVAWVIVIIASWLLISARHNTGIFGAIGVTILAFILYVIVAILLGILLDVTLIILPF